MKRRATTSCHSMVKSILYQEPFSTRDTLYGQENESVAIELFNQKTGFTVRDSGLYIDLVDGFLGASPDGKKTFYGCLCLKIK